MKINKFFYVFLILVAGMLYSFTGNSLMFLLSGVAVTNLMVSRNPITAGVASVLTLGYLFVFNSTAEMATMFLLCGILPGMVLGFAYKKALPLSYLVAIPACGFALSWVYLFFSYNSVDGENMFEYAVGMIDMNFDKSLAMIMQQYGEQLDREVIDLLTATMDTMLEVLLHMVPCMIILYSCVMALLLVLFTKKTASAFGCATKTGFSQIYAPGGVSFLIFICLIGAYFAKDYAYFFMNLLVIFLAFYMLCGLSVIDFYFRRLIEKSWLRALIYAFVFFAGSLVLPQLLWAGLIIVCMADILFDFRKLRPLPNFPDNDQ